MAAVPWTKVLVVSYPARPNRTAIEEPNEDEILSGSAAARTDVYRSGAAALRAVEYYDLGIIVPIPFDIGFLPTYN
jgi:hypothetical protein